MTHIAIQNTTVPSPILFPSYLRIRFLISIFWFPKLLEFVRFAVRPKTQRKPLRERKSRMKTGVIGQLMMLDNRLLFWKRFI